LHTATVLKSSLNQQSVILKLTNGEAGEDDTAKRSVLGVVELKRLFDDDCTSRDNAVVDVDQQLEHQNDQKKSHN
jgi:hypothetical protein